MRFLFALTLLVFALMYTSFGLYSLDLLNSSGRLGPGFFPLLIGLLMVATSAANCVLEYRKQRVDSDELQETWKDVLEMALLIVLFLACLPYLGALLAMLIFCGTYLHRFNSGRIVFNGLYTILFSSGVFVLFEVILQAGLPEGLLAPLY